MIRRTFLTVTAAALAGCTAGSSDDAGESLDVEIVEGTPGRGETVTLRVTENGSPVEGATVRVDYQYVGTTDEDGRVTVTLPHEGDDAAIDAEKGDREGELAVEFDDGEEPDVDELSVAVVEGTPERGATVTVEVTAGGDPVAGAQVEVDGELVGTTDADGRLAVTLPETGDEVEIEAKTSDLSGELVVSLDN